MTSADPAILVVAGEPSGDEIAASVVEAAADLVPGIRFFGAIGPKLEEAGVERVVATRELAVMGLAEVVTTIPTAIRAMRRLADEADDRAAVGAILVDSPDFNLRLAMRLARRGIPVVQIVGPTVWAWREGRIRTLERAVRRLLVTLPFEEEVYEGTGVEAVYVGHPAVDRIPEDPPSREVVAERLGIDPDRPWVGVLPGSREGELGRTGVILARAAARLRARRPAVEIVVPVAPGLEPGEVDRALAAARPMRLVSEDRLEALARCDAAMTTSGTASLELALLGIPHAVAYTMNPLSYWAARLLVDVDHIALPNLVAGHRLVPEYVQAGATPDAVAAPIETWLSDADARETVVESLAAVREILGPHGFAPRAAASALEALGLVVAAIGPEASPGAD